jgi:hypothetical protein
VIAAPAVSLEMPLAAPSAPPERIRRSGRPSIRLNRRIGVVEDRLTFAFCSR